MGHGFHNFLLGFMVMCLVTIGAAILITIMPKSCEDYPKYRYDNGSVPVKCLKD